MQAYRQSSGSCSLDGESFLWYCGFAHNAYFFGEGLVGGAEYFFHLSAREGAMVFAFIGIWPGLLIAWKWEVWAGFVTICGVVAFYLLDYLFSGSFRRGPYLVVFSSPSLLFLYCGFQARVKSEV